MDAQTSGVPRIGADHDAVAELGEHLAARAAGTQRRAGCDDGNCFELAMSLTHGFANGHTLGAIGQPVAGVLDVDAREHLAAFREQGGADAKLRIRRVGVSLGGPGGGDQFAKLERTGFHSAPMNSPSSLASLPWASRPTSSTSSCESFLLEMPAARLVMQETPATSMLW